jgi:GNAT superfamily N-acetyltransferase
MVKAKKEHIEGIIKVHIQAFTTHLLTKLGPPFLRLYYLRILDYKNGILLVSVDQNGIITGFAAGFLYPEQFYSILKSRRFQLAWACLPGLIKSPSLFKRVLGNANSLQDADQVKKGLSDKACELSSIAICPSHQRKGLGKLLLNSFENQAKMLGANQIYLNTDRLNNNSVNQFYSTSGYKIVKVYNAPGDRQMNQYTMEI